jgi:hypothetical protein
LTTGSRCSLPSAKFLHDEAFITFMYDLNLEGLSGHGNRTEDLKFGFISLQGMQAGYFAPTKT